ncbi:MAG TPA: SOS response-associated peptidase [Gammaproteobacteria bacterium]
MPGRYFIVTPPESARNTLFPEGFNPAPVAAAFESPRYNIAPSQTAPILRVIEGELVVSDMRWGFAPRWMKDPNKAQINARSETLFEKPMFKQAATKQRCLVPTSGWYEWQPSEDGKKPWALHREGYEPFAIAGLWTVGNNKEGGPEENFLTLTTEPSAQVKPIHHRMPVILDAEGCRIWLDPGSTQDQLTALLIPWRGSLTMHRISTVVNSPKHHGPECLEEVKAWR